MTTFFIIYAIYALVVLISCSCATAASSVRYVSISRPVVDKWILSGRRPILLEVCSRKPNTAGSHDWDIPLIVAQQELANLIRWLPPSSLLVVQSPEALHRLDREVESVLVDLGILVVYWVPEEAKSPLILPVYR